MSSCQERGSCIYDQKFTPIPSHSSLQISSRDWLGFKRLGPCFGSLYDANGLNFSLAGEFHGVLFVKSVDYSLRESFLLSWRKCCNCILGCKLFKLSIDDGEPTELWLPKAQAMSLCHPAKMHPLPCANSAS